MVPQVHTHTHMIPRSTGLCQLNHLTLEWKLDQLQSTIPPFLQPIQRIRHVPKQSMAKETLLEPHAYRRLRNDMKSTWITEMQTDDMCKQGHLLHVLSAKSSTEFAKSFFIGFEVWDASPTFQKQQLSWLYIEI